MPSKKFTEKKRSPSGDYHLNVSAEQLRRWDLAADRDHFPNRKAWLVKMADDRCDALRIPTEDGE